MHFLKRMSALPFLTCLTLCLVLGSAGAANAQTTTGNQAGSRHPSSFEFPRIRFEGDYRHGIKHITINGDCAMVTLDGSHFSPPGPRYVYKARLIADGPDPLEIHPGEIKIDTNGHFHKTFKVCGISRSFEVITISALDKLTERESNVIRVVASERD